MRTVEMIFVCLPGKETGSEYFFPDVYILTLKGDHG